jgi:hypothetical protein
MSREVNGAPVHTYTALVAGDIFYNLLRVHQRYARQLPLEHGFS